MRARTMSVLLLLCLLAVGGCGSTSALIKTPAEDMNLSAADLGSQYGLLQEWAKDEFLDEFGTAGMEEPEDANFRMFQTPDGMVMAVVLTDKRPFSSGDMRDFVEGVEEGILGELPGMEMEERRAPAVGDEANLIGVDVEDLGVSMYILSFRKVNVIGVVVVMGTDAAATEAAAAEFGKNMDAKIR